MPICIYPAIAAPERSCHTGPIPSTNIPIQPHSTRILAHQANGSVVVPGDILAPPGACLITGHGTYRDQDPTSIGQDPVDQSTSLHSDDGSLNMQRMRSSLTGRVRLVNKLMYVQPANVRYSGNVGDTVVGRITEVEQRRWRVDLNSYLLGHLALSNVKLPGGELRRKSEDDERAMRSFMKEGDLIVAEVHEIYKDGTLQLHMPGTRTGKLGGGCLLRISPSLVKRQKIHRHQLSIPTSKNSDYFEPSNTTGGATHDNVAVGLILGCNGYVWIGPVHAMNTGLGLAAAPGSNSIDPKTPGRKEEQLLAERLAVARVRNCVFALANNAVPVWEASVLAACEVSCMMENEDNMDDDDDGGGGDFNMKDGHSSDVGRIAGLLRPDVGRKLAAITEARLANSS